ncbi:unnamed protein product [Albugo candida]|nr:unnamed protein product [Albugo candida]|eukprot:CCI39352.1 unnamed protein product [Albugo candida]
MLDSSERSKKEADVDAKANIENDPNEVKHNLVRVDPVERRREAIARRRKKEEKLLDQMIFTEKSEETSLFTERKRTCVSAIMGSCRPQLRLLLTQEFIARAILVGFAITTALTFDIRSLQIDTAPEALRHFINSYRGQMSDDSIRQQFGRDDEKTQLDKMDSYSLPIYQEESMTGWFDQTMPRFITSPPLIATIVIIRYTTTSMFEAFRKLFGNSAVPLAEEQDLGFILSMLLCNRPKLKVIFRMIRASFDDVCLILYCFCIIVAVRNVKKNRQLSFWNITEAYSKFREMYAGIDIGGSAIKLGLVDLGGNLLIRNFINIDSQLTTAQDAVTVSHRMLIEQLQALDKSVDNLLAIGIGCPGQINEYGVLQAAANFPAWVNVPLKQLFQERFDQRVEILNDADAAVLAELWVGAAKRDVQSFIMITLGTGIGVGLVIDGQLIRGAHGLLEGGHMIIEKDGRQCGCSQRGCLEAYASATALISCAKMKLKAGTPTKLSDAHDQTITAEMIFGLAVKGDRMCMDIVEEAADYLGFACVNLSRILDPELILFSGGLAEAGNFFVDLIRKAAVKYSWTKFPNRVSIKRSSTGYDAGIIGAAAAVHFENIKHFRS